MLKMLDTNVAIMATTKETSESGIIISKAKEKQKVGIAKFVGPGTKEEKMLVCAGDNVVFDGFYDSVKVGDGEYYFVKQSDIKAIIE